MKTKRLVGAFAFAVCGLGWVACTGSAGPAGPQGDPGTAGATGATGATGPVGPASSTTTSNTPAISAVSPLVGLTDRDATITVSGSDTNWSSAAKVDLGAGIMVNKTTVASPASIVVEVTIAGSAAVGPRDVTVTDGAASFKYAGAFMVSPPAPLQVLGTQAQGSILALQANDLDANSLFDNSSTTDLFGDTQYTNFAVNEMPSGIAYQINYVGSNYASITSLIDLDAPTGAQSVTLENGPSGAATEFPNPGAYTVAARTPTPLVLGTPATGTYANAFESELLSFSIPSTLSVIDLAATATGAGSTKPNLQYVRLPSTGHFADLIEVASVSIYTSDAADSGYLVAWDNSGASGYTYNVSAKATPATGVPQATTLPTTLALAQVIDPSAGPIIVQGMTVTTATDVRYLQVNVGAASVGKFLRVLAEAGPTGSANTDVAVDIQDSTGTSLLSGGAVDTGLPENVLTSAAIATAGTYYVILTAGQNFATTDTGFQTMVRFE